jgi:hypothetical protein
MCAPNNIPDMKVQLGSPSNVEIAKLIAFKNCDKLTVSRPSISLDFVGKEQDTDRFLVVPGPWV